MTPKITNAIEALVAALREEFNAQAQTVAGLEAANAELRRGLDMMTEEGSRWAARFEALEAQCYGTPNATQPNLANASRQLRALSAWFYDNNPSPHAVFQLGDVKQAIDIAIDLLERGDR